MFFSPNNSLFVIEPLPYIEILKYMEFWSCFKPPEKLATFPCQAIATWSVSDNSEKVDIVELLTRNNVVIRHYDIYEII